MQHHPNSSIQANPKTLMRNSHYSRQQLKTLAMRQFRTDLYPTLQPWAWLYIIPVSVLQSACWSGVAMQSRSLEMYQNLKFVRKLPINFCSFCPDVSVKHLGEDQRAECTQGVTP